MRGSMWGGVRRGACQSHRFLQGLALPPQVPQPFVCPGRILVAFLNGFADVLDLPVDVPDLALGLRIVT